jgi:hypothetical protein
MKSRARTLATLVVGAGALLTGAFVVGAILGRPRSAKAKSKRGTSPKDTKNKPPGARDTPRVARTTITHQTATVEEALSFVSEEMAAKAIRDGRPVVYMVHSEVPVEHASAWRSFVSTFALAFTESQAHFAAVTCLAWPLDQVLVGAIYQQSNGIWTATGPTPDMIYRLDGDSPSEAIKAAREVSGRLRDVLLGTREPASASELTPEQARLIRDGHSVDEAINLTS